MTTETDETKAARVFLRAAEILVVHGWTKGHYARTNSAQKTNWCDPEAVCFCLLGAVYKASSELNLDHDYAAWLVERGLEKYGSTEDALSVWNDAPQRTRDEVVTLLRTTAADLMEGAS